MRVERRQEEGQRRVEELWMPSERAHFERLARQRRQDRLEFHEGQVRRLSVTLGSLVAYHEAEAAKCRENGAPEEMSA